MYGHYPVEIQINEAFMIVGKDQQFLGYTVRYPCYLLFIDILFSLLLYGKPLGCNESGSLETAT